MGLRCKNFWSNQIFEDNDERYQMVPGIENPIWLSKQKLDKSSGKWVDASRAKDRGEAIKMCEDICLDTPACEGFHFEEMGFGCYFYQGFEKLQR